MKKPFTLLCLSDCHIESKSDSGQKSELEKLLKQVKEISERNPIWRPDYLVVAGDLRKAKENYDSTEEIVNSLLDELNLMPDKFIAVPGNHDKDVPDETDFDEEKNILNRFFKSGDEINTQKDKGDLELHFNSFKCFYDKYNEGRNEDSRFEFASTSFLKVFHDTQVCFLGINTEISYYPNNNYPLYLYPPVIFPFLRDIALKYPDYSIVTVMHRDPRELSWEDRVGQQDRAKPELLNMIYSISDVILTGHDHVEQNIPPDLMANRSQLFKLGSSSMEPRNGDVLARHKAYLLNIDPIHKRLSYIVIENKGNTSQEQPWKEIYKDVFLLQNKYRSNYYLIPSNHDNQVKCIRAKSSSSTDVEEVLREGISEEYELECISYEEIGSHDVAISEKCKVVYIYGLCIEEVKEHIIQELKNAVNTFTKKNRDAIISMKLIVNYALVEVPVWDSCRENWQWQEMNH